MYVYIVDKCTDSADTATEKYGSKCYNVKLDRLECIGGLGCSDWEAWKTGIPSGPNDYPCEAEDRYFADTCVSSGSGGGGGGGSSNCSSVSRSCTITYDSFGNPTEHCTCSPSCCC